jgi:PhzF family phenazine biosynthesis protein
VTRGSRWPALRALALGTGLSVASYAAGGSGDAAGGRAHARVFVPAVGVPEDPATGSAAVALGVHLVEAGLVTASTAYRVEQGRETGRPSQLDCTVEVRDGRAVRATVTGGVVPVARGQVRRPPPAALGPAERAGAHAS